MYPMQELQLPRFPWDKIAIDITGCYLTSYNGSNYLITIMDLLTSYPEAYPVPGKSAETVAKVLSDKLIPTLSCPITVSSDCGMEYKN